MSEIKAAGSTLLVVITMLVLDLIFQVHAANLSLAMFATYQAFRAQRDGEGA